MEGPPRPLAGQFSAVILVYRLPYPLFRPPLSPFGVGPLCTVLLLYRLPLSLFRPPSPCGVVTSLHRVPLPFSCRYPSPSDDAPRPGRSKRPGCCCPQQGVCPQDSGPGRPKTPVSCCPQLGDCPLGFGTRSSADHDAPRALCCTEPMVPLPGSTAPTPGWAADEGFSPPSEELHGLVRHCWLR